MIINTGMRTDIPAFYPKWLLNRIREGFVYVRNPYYEYRVTKYSLNPNVVYQMFWKIINSPFLIGELELDDKITEANQKSWLEIDNQISLL